MERKDYKLEIVNELLNKKWHVRALAKKLATNHTTISRKLNELHSENVLDYNEEGKNKTYFLKTTPEAKTYIFMTENYKLRKLLEKYPLLRPIIEKIQGKFEVKLATIFGSYTKFSASKSSDIDIYVETTSSKLKKEIESFSSRINVKIGKYDKNNLLIKEIEKNHVIIKGVEIFYERYGFFE